ncbi:hypothetical protein FQN60_008430, partial [Etheostoma spectabile]
MRRNSEPTVDRERSLSPVGCLSAVSVLDMLPELASTVLASTVGLLRDSAAVQSINRRLNRRTMSSPEMCWPVPMRAIGAQNLLTMPGGVSTSGYLHKKGGSQFSLMKWPLRYIIIHKCCVYYFKSSTSPAPQGAFSLNGYNRIMRAAEETTSSNVFPFKIVHFSKKHRTWFFSAASEDERRKWMRYLRREIDHYNDRKESQISSDSDTDADSFYGTIEKPMDIKQPFNNAEDDYVEDDDDDDDDEEDYLKPDAESSPTSTESRMALNGPSHRSLNALGSQSMCSNHHREMSNPRGKPSLPPQVNIGGANLRPVKSEALSLNKTPPSHPPLPCHPPIPPLLKAGLLNKPAVPKPPPPTLKPSLPAAKPKQPGTPLQRASPDGQSFRSLGDETPTEFRMKRDSKPSGGYESDDDYENMQLPDSVFIDTTESSFVEKLFKESPVPPQDGLYGIRNSGTKTSK